MKSKEHNLHRCSIFKIVFFYAATSVTYIYTSDYILQLLTSDVELVSKLQTYKGLGFILITSLPLYFLIKRNNFIISSYYKQIGVVQEVADRHAIELKNEYMTIFENSPLPTWLFDPQTLQFLMVNETACEVYQYSKDEFLSMTLRDIRPAQDISILEELISNTILKERITLPKILRHKKKNGELIHVKIKVAFVNFNGKKARLASVIDLTREIDSQLELINLNSRFQMASELAGLGYWSHKIMKSEFHWSEEMYKIFELDRSTFELSINNIKNRFHPEDQLNFSANYYDQTQHNTIHEIERRIITPSGKLKWLLERQYLTKDKDGIAVSIEGVILDITKRKLHEQKIKESNDRFKMLAKATIEAIIDWDIENKEVIWGEGFHTMHGYDLNTSDYYLWAHNIHCEDKKRVLTDLQKAIQDPARDYFNAEFRFLKANGEIIYAQLKGIFIRNENGKAIRVLGAMNDLTEALTRVRKIESLDKALKEIAWTQSHIVRAPLANLLGLIGLLKNKVNTGLSDNILLGHIDDSANKLDAVIREIVMKTSVMDEKNSSEEKSV